METLEIQAEAEVASKREARRLRRAGKIPGVLYGPKTPPVPLELNKKEFSSRVAGLEGSHLVRLKSGSPALAAKVALVKAMQYHPITGDVIHTDLYEVDLTAKIQACAPSLLGKAVGLCAVASCNRSCAKSRSNVYPWTYQDFSMSKSVRSISGMQFMSKTCKCPRV